MVTFHKEAVTREVLRSLDFLRGNPLEGFYLAGGTALALQLGHRISIDLDWFSTTRRLERAERDALTRGLSASGDLVVRSEEDGQLHVRLLGTDVSLIHQPHPLLEDTVDFEGIPLAGPVDIGLMKLAAINSRGTRRDFIDLHFLQEVAPLTRLLPLAERKYADRPSFLAITARALAYFVDAEQQPMPRLLRPVRWEDVRRTCEEGARWLVDWQRKRQR